MRIAGQKKGLNEAIMLSFSPFMALALDLLRLQLFNCAFCTAYHHTRNDAEYK